MVLIKEAVADTDVIAGACVSMVALKIVLTLEFTLELDMPLSVAIAVTKCRPSSRDLPALTRRFQFLEEVWHRLLSYKEVNSYLSRTKVVPWEAEIRNACLRIKASDQRLMSRRPAPRFDKACSIPRGATSRCLDHGPPLTFDPSQYRNRNRAYRHGLTLDREHSLLSSKR